MPGKSGRHPRPRNAGTADPGTRDPGTAGLLAERLKNQKLARTDLIDPEAVVAWFGAMQAQDFPGAKWAIGLRAKHLTDAAVERAFNEGRILRTHVLRPTWHFVTPTDIRWLLALTGPRVLARMSSRHRQLELDSATVKRSREAIARALTRSADPLTRMDLRGVLERAGIALTPERLSHLILFAELEGMVCSGPLRDRKFTYALIDRRAPSVPPIDREQALARLAERYLRSHGPATPADFAWWSGLTLREAKIALESCERAISRARSSDVSRTAWLLPDYDEYLVAYKDREAILGRGIDPRLALTRTIIIGGRAVGTWAARRARGAISLRIVPRRALTRENLGSIQRAARDYGAFVGLPVTIALG